MKTTQLLVALVAAGAVTFFAPALTAQMGQPKGGEEKPKAGGEEKPEGKEEPKEEPKAEENQADKMEKLFKNLDEVTGKTEYTEDDVKNFIKHHDEIKKLTEADAEFKKKSDANLKEAFDYLVKNEKWVAWCKEKGVDADKYLRKHLRIMTTYMKIKFEDIAKNAIENIDGFKKMLEEMKGEMEEADYKKQMEQIDQAKKDVERMNKAIQTSPGPTDAEKKALTAHEEEIGKAMPMGGEGEEGGDDDGMGN